ncbi:transcription elongation factor GreA [Lachnospiraceae bacterium M18-1]|jgi:transcription elongation factor GreA|nr:transcription elongation factor GreA [Lachnospiraceae bacterium M18-1]
MLCSRMEKNVKDKLTKSDVKKIEEEIEHRKLVVRKAAIEAVKEARAHGDLSENFEYHAAKKDKNQNESRIRYLERMLKNAVIVDDSSKEDEVGINNTVELYIEEDDVTEVYRLVTSIRGSSLNGLISIESPLGKAIIGHKENDRVYIRVNDDYGYYAVIKKIENTQEEEGDHIRSF